MGGDGKRRRKGGKNKIGKGKRIENMKAKRKEKRKEIDEGKR